MLASLCLTGRFSGAQAAKRMVCDALNWISFPSYSRALPPLHSRIRMKTCKYNYIRSFHTSFRLLQTHYEILGVSKTATPKEVTKAYRAKAKEYHPDLNKDANAQAKFVAVKEAYECLRDPHKRSHYDSTLEGSSGSPYSQGYGAAGRGGFRHTGFKSPSWESREAERKLWEELRTHRQYTRANWDADRRRMDEQMRKSEQMEALRSKLQPYFNIALVASLIALGATSLYIQYRARSKPRTHQNFAPSAEELPTYFSRYRTQQRLDASVPDHDHEPYHPIDPHRKYQTKWDEINESVERRDDFYRALLRGDETFSRPNSKTSSVS